MTDNARSPNAAATGQEGSTSDNGASTELVRIVATTLTGQTFGPFMLAKNTTIHRLKTLIGEQDRIPAYQQRLIWDGNILDDHQTLQHYGIVNEANLHLVLGLRKPIIYLFPHRPLTATVEVTLVPQWTFSAIYPMTTPKTLKTGSEQVSWCVDADPSGLLVDKGSSLEIAYLFWEAETNSRAQILSPPSSRAPTPSTFEAFNPAAPSLSPSDSIILPSSSVMKYLHGALNVLCLHTEAITSFITYWLPSILKHKHVALRFLPQEEYECVAALTVKPKPDVVTRVFMLFRGVKEEALEEWAQASERAQVGVEIWKDIVDIDGIKMRDTTLFRVLEWGGMEVY